MHKSLVLISIIEVSKKDKKSIEFTFKNDTFKIVKKQIYNNGVALGNPLHRQFQYWIEMQPNKKIGANFISKYNLNATRPDFEDGGYSEQGNRRYLVTLDSPTLKKIKKSRNVKSVKQKYDIKEMSERSEFRRTFPTERLWSNDNYGSIVIPFEGMVIDINKENLDLYYRAIEYYEGNTEVVRTDDNRLLMKGKEVSTYTFLKNYYFMCGDNRNTSLDSRFWGYVPEDHIVGKAFLVLMSVDQHSDGGFFSRIRWDRVFNIIKHGDDQ